MLAKLKRLSANLFMFALSLAITLGVLEFGVFRQLLVPDDVLANVSINGVVRYQPNTIATFRHPDASTSTVRINADGWNSSRTHYAKQKPDGVLRIAVIGDSYVHGAFVETHQGFPEVMEKKLNGRGVASEVLRFGMDGAPLSQYLHVLRREVVGYRPDVVVIPLIHNDFDESYRFLGTRYNSTFMKIERDENGAAIETMPADFKPGMADRLRDFATFRYLYYETGAYLHLKSFVTRWIWGSEETWSPEFISSAVDIRNIRDREMNRFVTHHVISEMQALARQHGFKLVLLMDAVREAVYAKRPASDFEVSSLNALAADVTAELAVPFLDLQQAFAADFAKRGERFEFAYDWHWNGHANELVAEAAIGFMTELGLVSPGNPLSGDLATLGGKPGAEAVR